MEYLTFMCDSGVFRALWNTCECRVTCTSDKRDHFPSALILYITNTSFFSISFNSTFEVDLYLPPVLLQFQSSGGIPCQASLMPTWAPLSHMLLYRQQYMFFLGWVLFAKSGPVFTDNDFLFVSFSLCVLFFFPHTAFSKCNVTLIHHFYQPYKPSIVQHMMYVN